MLRLAWDGTLAREPTSPRQLSPGLSECGQIGARHAGETRDFDVAEPYDRGAIGFFHSIGLRGPGREHDRAYL